MNEQIDGTHKRGGLPGDGIDLLLVAEIRGDAESDSAGGGYLCDRRIQGRFVARHHDDAHPAPGQNQRQGATKTAARTSYQSGSVVETHDGPRLAAAAGAPDRRRNVYGGGTSGSFVCCLLARPHSFGLVLSGYCVILLANLLA